MLAVLVTLAVFPLQVLAHGGHDHKVLGTVTMAAADHVMLKDMDNKDVTVYLTRETKVFKDKKAATVEDIKAGLRVVITATTVKENNVEKMVARQVELGAAQPTR
jgi:predicted lactoylglutathione lyase